jgi:hypothetical protein
MRGQSIAIMLLKFGQRHRRTAPTGGSIRERCRHPEAGLPFGPAAVGLAAEDGHKERR